MAVVEVHDWRVKPGGVQSLATLMRDTSVLWRAPAGVPSYRSVRLLEASNTRVVLMAEWASLADSEKWYAAVGADPAGQEYFRRFSEILVYSEGVHYWTPLFEQAGGKAGAIVFVTVTPTQWGSAAEAAGLIQAELARYAPPEGTPAYRRFRAYEAPGSRLVGMIDWDSLADSEKWWAAWAASPGWKAYLDPIRPLLMPGGTEEYWTPVLEA